ncbi:hypothetical protein [Marinobacter sp. NSM]|uniref:hypothetical protein n=1 Tax=Marinobacter sp. NSM TaxID=3458004 RepID=UPI004036D849
MSFKFTSGRTFRCWRVPGKWVLLVCCSLLISGCLFSDDITMYRVFGEARGNGSISPERISVLSDAIVRFELTADEGHEIASVEGCDGSLEGTTYSTRAVNGDCKVVATFRPIVEDDEGTNTDPGTDNDNPPAPVTYSINTNASTGGAFSPAATTVIAGNTASFTLTADPDYRLVSATGCGGRLEGNLYVTNPINENCTINATFIRTFEVTASAGENGSITPASTRVDEGSQAAFTVSPGSGFKIAAITGCEGSLSGATYTTGAVTADCSVTVSFSRAELTITPIQTKTLRFNWDDASGETEYRLLENPDGISGYSEIAVIPADTTEFDLEVFLPERVNASYILQSCVVNACVDFADSSVSSNLAEAVGFVKASNTSTLDEFGSSLAISADGLTLAVSAPFEDSSAVLVNGDQSDNSDNPDIAPTAVRNSGAVYVFSKSDGLWAQQAYIKALNPNANANFGFSVALSANGDVLAVGAINEGSSATGIDGDSSDTSSPNSGAVYVYSRSAEAWGFEAYIKASNTDSSDAFGYSVALSGDAQTLAVGAIGEDSNATGINGNEADNSTFNTGAVYVFSKSGGNWAQEAYIKASNTNQNDRFGFSVALSDNGDRLVASAEGEDSNATGVNGDASDNSSIESGAAYLFSRNNDTWSQEAYLKASNTGGDDRFGQAVAISADGNTVAVGAPSESSSATGINGEENDNTSSRSGAVYIFTHDSGTWLQQAYIKASNADSADRFGTSVALSSDGNYLAVGAPEEDGVSRGINGNANDNSATFAGAAYLFSRNTGSWEQRAYVKASNTMAEWRFGRAISLSGDADILAVGSPREASFSEGVNGIQLQPGMFGLSSSGAVYLY